MASFEEAMATLATLFENVDRDVIEIVLESNSGDINRAVDALLQMNEDDSAPGSHQHGNPPQTNIPETGVSNIIVAQPVPEAVGVDYLYGDDPENSGSYNGGADEQKSIEDINFEISSDGAPAPSQAPLQVIPLDPVGSPNQTAQDIIDQVVPVIGIFLRVNSCTRLLVLVVYLSVYVLSRVCTYVCMRVD